MNFETLINVGREALLLMVLASAPPVLSSLVVGFLAGLFQATTQIQESTLSVVPKLCAAALSLAIAAPWIAAQLSRFATQLFLSLAQVSS